MRPFNKGGYGLDSLWNDDFHHSAMVALTGRNEAYYCDYLGNPQEFLSAVKWGYLYQGQRYKWQKKRRGTPSLDLDPACFVNFIQNHDQLANSVRGLRVHQRSSPARYRAMTALLLLGPGTPMLFQGQEFAASSPFCYFADHKEELAKRVCKGRAKFLAQFPSIAPPQTQACLPDPADPRTFERCKLDLGQRERHAEAYRLHADLLKLRREEPVFRAQRRGAVDGAILSAQAFVLRYFGGEPGVSAPGGTEDRLLVANFGRDLPLDPAPEPLLAPLEGRLWEIQWSSEDCRYGGSGTPPVDTADDTWRIPGEAAVVLRPAPRP